MLLTVAIYPIFRFARRALGVERHSCLCVGSRYEILRLQPDGTLVVVRTGMALEAGQRADCVERYQGRMLGVDANRTLDALHYLSAGAVGVTRGLNDTPKIVALLMAGAVLAPTAGLIVVAGAMAIGALISARRVARTIACRITAMNAGQGFTANLVTACSSRSRAASVSRSPPPTCRSARSSASAP